MTDTLANLEAAIQAHIGSIFEGEHVDGWVCVIHSQTIDAHTTSNYRIVTPDVQPHHIDAGLLATGDKIVQDSWDYASTTDDED